MTKQELRSLINEEIRNTLNEDTSIDARRIVINCLKMYNLTQVEKKNHHEDLANEIINDLVNAGFMK